MRSLVPTLLVLMSALPLAAAQRVESIWCVRNNEEGVRSFLANASRISVIAPQV